MNYWLVKSEPFKYSWTQFTKDRKTFWDGVRNFEARNHLRAMKLGDLAFFYHSNEGKEVVGIARVVKEAYPDPTVEEGEKGDWSGVEFAPFKPMVQPVTLADIKAEPTLKDIALVRRLRLSVIAVSKKEFDTILRMGKTKI